jgi:hypothetical protein
MRILSPDYVVKVKKKAARPLETPSNRASRKKNYVFSLCDSLFVALLRLIQFVIEVSAGGKNCCGNTAEILAETGKRVVKVANILSRVEKKFSETFA